MATYQYPPMASSQPPPPHYATGPSDRPTRSSFSYSPSQNPGYDPNIPQQDDRSRRRSSATARGTAYGPSQPAVVGQAPQGYPSYQSQPPPPQPPTQPQQATPHGAVAPDRSTLRPYPAAPNAPAGLSNGPGGGVTTFARTHSGLSSVTPSYHRNSVGSMGQTQPSVYQADPRRYSTGAAPPPGHRKGSSDDNSFSSNNSESSDEVMRRRERRRSRRSSAVSNRSSGADSHRSRHSYRDRRTGRKHHFREDQKPTYGDSMMLIWDHMRDFLSSNRS